jgi:hypothetical protein
MQSLRIAHCKRDQAALREYRAQVPEPPFLITHHPVDDSSNPRRVSRVFYLVPQRGDYYWYVNPRRFTTTEKPLKVVLSLLCLAIHRDIRA